MHRTSVEDGHKSLSLYSAPKGKWLAIIAQRFREVEILLQLKYGARVSRKSR
jgi:hypothetical protein